MKYHRKSPQKTLFKGMINIIHGHCHLIHGSSVFFVYILDSPLPWLVQYVTKNHRLATVSNDSDHVFYTYHIWWTRAATKLRFEILGSAGEGTEIDHAELRSFVGTATSCIHLKICKLKFILLIFLRRLYSLPQKFLIWVAYVLSKYDKKENKKRIEKGIN